MTNPAAVFALLVFCHALADYPLQGDFLSKAKNRASPIPGVPWWQALSAHSIIQAGPVWIVTGLWWCAALELVIHFLTDDAQCRGRISFNQDQAIHIGCKLLWAAAAAAVGQ